MSWFSKANIGTSSAFYPKPIDSLIMKEIASNKRFSVQKPQFLFNPTVRMQNLREK
jgi:hypothetical protein